MSQPIFVIKTRGKADDLAKVLKAADDVSKLFSITLQPVSARAVFDARHAEAAAESAFKAIAEGREPSNNTGGAILRHLTGQRQVAKAIEAGGLVQGEEGAVVIAAGGKAGAAIWRFMDALGWSKDPAGVGLNPAALDALGVTAAEREATPRERWGDLALERVAMLALDKH
jgi:tRNA threonylcarbamoyladenosine modification (KEOPS) complex Cgi121 subunit